MKIVFSLAIVMLIGSHVYAAEESLVPTDATTVTTLPSDVISTDPADTEEIGKIKNPKDHSKKDRKANFGALVSAEAHRLHDEGLNGKQKMGPWVSGQRRENDPKKSRSTSATSGNSHRK